MSKPALPPFFMRLFRRIVPSHLLEEIEGDLIQRFQRDSLTKGEAQARRTLWWNAIRFLRPGIVLRKNYCWNLSTTDMLQNYFKIASRQFLKNKVFSAINVTGLAVGLTAFLLIMLFVRFERSYEDFNPDVSRTYRITLDIYKGKEFVTSDCEMFAPVGKLLNETMPEVEDYVRIYRYDGNQEVKAESKVFFEDRVFFADPSLFRMFGIAPTQGDPRTALTEPSLVAIAESKAKKYFNKTDVLGETIEIGHHLYKISAVISDPPPNTHVKFDFILSHATLPLLWNYKDDEYSGNNEYLYVRTTVPVDLAAFNEKLRAVAAGLKEQIGPDNLFVAEPMKDIHLYSARDYEPEPCGNARSVYILFVVAVTVIAMAWINYINLATARAVNRAREVGIRKVMGSWRVQLIFQFLSESFLLTFVAGIVSIALLYLSLPFFARLTGQPLPLSIFRDAQLWLLFAGMLTSGSVVAGLYPAFVLSSFEPVLVLKGNMRSSMQGQWLRKGLVVFQFATTVVLIGFVCTVYLQLDHLRKQDLGMNINQILVVRSPTLSSDSLYAVRCQELEKELIREAAVDRVARSGAIPGGGLNQVSTTGNIYRPERGRKDKGYIYCVTPFDEDYIPVLGMELIAGRNFEPGRASANRLILNEEALRLLGYASPAEAVGSRLMAYNEEMTVIGVVKNFYLKSPKEKHLPIVFWYSNDAEFFLMPTQADRAKETITVVEGVWKKIFPDSPLDYFFLDEQFNRQYQSDRQLGAVMSVFSALAAFIATLGLFGLTSFMVVQRTREVGIRKVLGASANQIVRLLSREFLMLLVLAFVFSVPLAYLINEGWLTGFAVRMPVTVWIYLLPIGVVLAVALATVSLETYKAAQANPADSLKTE